MASLERRSGGGRRPDGRRRVRCAREKDLPAVVALLADDELGRRRESPGDELADSYRRAFAAIAADPNHELVVVESEGRVVATLQLSFLPNLSYQGGWRAQIEGVRVARDQRGCGLGAELIRWAIERARARSCALVQLTTDKKRPAAIRFYRDLGFEPSHEGMKFML